MSRAFVFFRILAVILVSLALGVFLLAYRWSLRFSFTDNVGLTGLELNRIALGNIVKDVGIWQNGVFLWDSNNLNGQIIRVVPRRLHIELTREMQRYNQLRRFKEGVGATVDLGTGQLWDEKDKRLTIKIYLGDEFLSLTKDPEEMGQVLSRYITSGLVVTAKDGVPSPIQNGGYLLVDKQTGDLLTKYGNIIQTDRCGGDFGCRFYRALGRWAGYIKFGLLSIVSPAYGQTCGGFIECGIPWVQKTCSDGSGYCYGSACNGSCGVDNLGTCQCEDICDYGEFTDVVCSFRTDQFACLNYGCQPGACTNPSYNSSCTWSVAPTPTPTPPPSCPNGFCGSGETCSNCAADCEPCPTPTPPPGCTDNYWKCSGSICLQGSPGDGQCGSCPAGCSALKGKKAFVVYNDSNQNGVWDYATEKRISSGNSTTCPGTNIEYVSGFGITYDGSGYSIDQNCNTDTNEKGPIDCNGVEGCNDGDNNGTATTCEGQWGDSGAIIATCIDTDACNGVCHWTGDYCKAGYSYSGALCGVRSGAYCTGSGTNGTLRDGPLLMVIKKEGSYPASVTIPSGWQASSGSPQSITVNVAGGQRNDCEANAADPNGGLIAFGVVRTPLPNPINLTRTCGATGNTVTIGWDNVAGAVDYMVRVDRNDGLIPEWYNPPPAGGDQIFFASNSCSSSGGRTTCVVNITAGATYTNWSVQPIASGESYPYISPAANGGSFTCSVPGTLSGTFFDASELASCPADPQTLDPSLKIGGRPITADGTIDYTGVTGSNGLYSITGMSTPATYNLIVNPGGTFVTTPKFACQGSTATFTATGGTLTRDFGFWKTYGGWFQALGGGVYGGSGITSNIPGSMPAADRYLIDTDADGQDGLAYYKSGSISLGTYPGLTVSVSGWNANSGYSGDRQDYAYWLAKMGIYTKTNWVGTGKPAYNPGTNGYEIYTYTGTATINFSPSANEKVIYLINGDVNVTGNITVPKTAGFPSFLAVIASGTITFANNVSSAQGLWVGNSISVASTGNTATEVPFAGEGSFVGWTSIALLRNRGTTNNTAPAEKFTYRPDLIINAPAPMKLADTVFRLETP